MNIRLMRRLIAGLLVCLLLPLGLVAAATTTPTTPDPVYSGTLTAIWADWPDGRAEPPRFFLATADARPLELLPGDAAASLLPLLGQRVTVSGSPLDTNTLAIDTVSPAPDGRAPTGMPETTGNSRWLVLGCKFPDIAATPHAMDYYQTMYRNTFPGLDHYWREVSYGLMDLAGSEARGWYTLPNPQASYFDGSSGGRVDWWEIVTDCAAAADADVYFPDYDGLSFILNDTHSGPALGGTYYLAIDGQARVYATNWMPTWAGSTMSVYQHEMGHGYRMGHSASPSGSTYEDVWDIMGNDRWYCATVDPDYGCIGKYPIAFHRAYRTEWLDGRVYVAGPGAHRLTLAPATRPAAAGYQMIRVPIDGDPTHYYTIEARHRESYDAGLPADAVILHEVNLNRLDMPWVIDPCPPGASCRGESERAILRVGEAFALAEGGFAVRVDGFGPDGYALTVVNDAQIHGLSMAPEADAYVKYGAPTTNFGTRVGLQVGPRDNPRSYLRFPALPEAITAIRLWMTPTGETAYRPSSASATSMTYKGTTTPWTETGLTWRNAPGIHDGGWATSGVTELEGGLAWDLWWTQYWTTPYQTLVVANGYSDVPIVTYGSRESAAPPYLIVDYIELPPVTETTRTTYEPTNDAFVRSGSPNRVYNKPLLSLKSRGPDTDSYIKFNVRGLSGSVQKATLRLFVKDAGPDGGSLFAVSPYYRSTTTQWLETGLTWLNAPTFSGTPLATVGRVKVRQWVEIDVTSAVVDGLVNQNGRVSFALSNSSTNVVSYSSKEGTHPPVLVVITVN